VDVAVDGVLGLAEGGVGGPAGTGTALDTGWVEVSERLFEVDVEAGLVAGWQVVVAESRVSDGGGDQYGVRRGRDRHELSGRGDTPQQPAAGGDELFGHQHGVGASDP
jgi:hypothetical protein